MLLNKFSVPGGGGGTLIFPYIRRSDHSWGVQNLEFQYIFLGGGLFRQMIFFFLGGGYEDWGSSQTGLV